MNPSLYTGKLRTACVVAPRFEGRDRQKVYMKCLRRMDPPSQEELRQIYNLAQHRQNIGQHVLRAMQAAARYPAIFKLIVINISLRLKARMAQNNQDKDKQARFEESLEDFHVALDAFMKGLSLEEAEAARDHEPHDPGPVREKVETDEAFFEDLQVFKDNIRPVLHRIQKSKPPRLA